MKQNHLMKHNLAGFILMAALSLVFIAALDLFTSCFGDLLL